MNKAVFLFTLFIRFSRPAPLLSIVFFTLGAPLFLSWACSEPQVTSMLIKPLMTGATMPMIIAMMFVKDAVANTRSINDGEYLALLFSRPLTRASYVLTKWVAGSLAVIAIWSAMLLIFHFAQLLQGREDSLISNSFTWLNLVLNSFSFTALIVLISAVPANLGIFLFLVLVYGSLFGSGMLDMSLRSNHGSTVVVQGFLAFFQFIRAVLFPGIDVYETLGTIRFSWLPIVSYLSDVSIYLLIATWLLNKREFSYASE